MWDGDPVSLHPHMPVESAKRYVDLIGADEILAEGQRAFDDGDYRWAAEILHKLVFAQPDNQDAEEPAGRRLRADGLPDRRPAMARHLPHRRPGAARRRPRRRRSPPPARTRILAMPLDILFDFAAVHVIGDKAADTDVRIDFTFTDLDETWTVWVKRGVLNARRGASPDTQLTVSGPKAAWSASSCNPPPRPARRGRTDPARRRRVRAGRPMPA